MDSDKKYLTQARDAAWTASKVYSPGVEASPVLAASRIVSGNSYSNLNIPDSLMVVNRASHAYGVLEDHFYCSGSIILSGPHITWRFPIHRLISLIPVIGHLIMFCLLISIFFIRIPILISYAFQRIFYLTIYIIFFLLIDSFSLFM